MAHTISVQVRKALDELGMTQNELASLLNLGLRQIQRKLKNNSWSVQEVEFLSKKLPWKFEIDPSGNVAGMQSHVAMEEDQTTHNKVITRPDYPIRLTIELDPDHRDFGKVSEFVKRLEEAFKDLQKP